MLYILIKYNFANAGMKPEEKFYNICMHLYNKKSGPKSMILNIECHSNIHT